MSKSAYQNLVAWKRARRLVRQVYDLTDAFPSQEQYGLTAEIRRASTSVPLNIAEGNGRLTVGEWQQFLGYARGSPLELESALILAFDLKYVNSRAAPTDRGTNRTRDQADQWSPSCKYGRLSDEEVSR